MRKLILLIMPLLFGRGFCFAIPEVSYNDSLLINQLINLNEVVISVNRDKTLKLKAPQQIFVFRKSLIQNANARSMSDLFLERGTLTVQKSQQGGGSPMIRGFEASRVLLMVDNVRMNNLIYRTGHLQNAITVDQNMLERVEVLYGPGSIAYGSDALGGTIHFYTREPTLNETNQQKSVHGNAFVRYGSVNNEITGHFDLNIGGDRFGSLTSVTYGNFGDLKGGRNCNPFLPEGDAYIRLKSYVCRIADGDEVRLNDKSYLQYGSGYSQYDLLQKFLYRPSQQTSHLLNIQISNSSDISRYDRLSEMNQDKPKYAEWYYGPQFRLMGSYELRSLYALGADRTSLVVAWQNVKESRHSRKLNAQIRDSRFEDVNMVTLNSDWIKRFKQHKLHAGIDGMLSLASSTAYGKNLKTGEITPLSTRYADGGNQMHSIESYLTHTWEINPKLTLYDGVRLGYNYLYACFNDKQFFPFLYGSVRQHTPTYSVAVGINYLPNDRWKMAFNLSSGFRVPNIDDLGKVFDSQPGRVVVPNPDLRPEQTLTADLNINYHINEHLVWENVLFGTYYFNAINLSPSRFADRDSIFYDGVLSEVYSSCNNKRAFLCGISSNFQANVSAHFSVDASLTYTYGRILKNPSNRPLDHIPPLYGRMGVCYDSWNDKFLLEFYSLFNGRKSRKNYNIEGEDNLHYATKLGIEGNGVPAWFTLNIKSSIRLYPYLTLQAGVENLLDTEYRMFASGINSPGRNIYVTLRSRF